MNEKEREILIKETRLATLRDLQVVLSKITEDHKGQEISNIAKTINHYLDLQISEVAQDTADRLRLRHQVEERE